MFRRSAWFHLCSQKKGWPTELKEFHLSVDCCSMIIKTISLISFIWPSFRQKNGKIWKHGPSQKLSWTCRACCDQLFISIALTTHLLLPQQGNSQRKWIASLFPSSTSVIPHIHVNFCKNGCHSSENLFSVVLTVMDVSTWIQIINKTN